MKRPMLALSDPAMIMDARKELGMNQTQFWERIGVTQSGGCRYENGRIIPKPVQLLLYVTYAADDRAQRLLQSLRPWQRAAPVRPTPAS